MTISSITRQVSKTFATLRLDYLLYSLSAYALPAAIALLSLVAVLFWEPHYSTAGAHQLPFRIVEQTAGDLPLDQAAHLASQHPTRLYHDTRLSEQPFWLSFEVRPSFDGTPVSIEFPSRHSTGISCWDEQTMLELGRASRSDASGEMAAVRAGFMLNLGHISAPRKVLCRQEFTGPARVDVAEWSTLELRIS